MSKELARRFVPATMTVVVDVEDDFGTVSHHTIPLVGEQCPFCKTVIHDNGVPDIEAAALKAVAHVDANIDAVLPQLEKAAASHPQIAAHIERLKARRSAK
jgi:hypothetical protein